MRKQDHNLDENQQIGQEIDQTITAQRAALAAIQANQAETVEALQAVVKEQASTAAALDKINQTQARIIQLLQAAQDDQSRTDAIVEVLALLGVKPSQPSASVTAGAGSGQSDALAARRWNALLASAYLRPLGNAGINSPMAGNYAHLGLELWTRYNVTDDDVGDENACAREWLTKYVDIAHAAQQVAKNGGAPLLTVG